MLQDKDDAPDIVLFLALKYFAKIHKFTWNKEQQCIPETVQHGQMNDILHLF